MKHESSICGTYLSIKQHSITGLKYFCKTGQDPFKYLGSGKYWKNHIRKHGREHVITLLVVGPYTDEEELTNLALWMSEEMDVVNSPEWANLKPENGTDGAIFGIKKSVETREKQSQSAKRAHKEGRAFSWNKLSFVQLSEAGKSGSKIVNKIGHNKGKPKPIVICPHCGKSGGGRGIMSRWHFDNCKGRI